MRWESVRQSGFSAERIRYPACSAQLNAFNLTEFGGVQETGLDIIGLQVFIVPEQVGFCGISAQQLKDHFDRIAQAADARLSVANPGIDGDSVQKCFHDSGYKLNGDCVQEFSELNSF